jgi:hypothetical protein
MTLTADYLAGVAERGPLASEIKSKALLSVTDTMYFGRCLSRPAFLAGPDLQQLSADLEVLHSALAAIPDRSFGGDLAAFARAAGLAEPQIRAVVRGRSLTPSRLARADVYQDEDGFRLLEINIGSTAGGIENTVLNRAMLEHSFIAEFVAEHELTYVETLEEFVQTMLTECKVPTGTRPFVVVTDMPGAFETLEQHLWQNARLLAPFGVDLEPWPLDALDYHDDLVWIGDRPVDIVYRLFMVGDLLSADGPDLLEPILRAVERGQVSIFSPLDSELFGSKGALALVSDEAYRDFYTEDDLAALDRILPWTRMVRPGPVTVDGAQVDLTTYALANREDLVLKPCAQFGGRGVVPGWQTDADAWAGHLSEAMDSAYVLQRRIRPVAELFPTDDGVEPWMLSWGAFTGARGYAGMIVRGSQELAGGVVNMATGATGTCCFHEAWEAG